MSSNFDSILKTIVTIYNRGIVQEGKSMGMMVDIVDMVYATHRGRGGAVLDRGTEGGMTQPCLTRGRCRSIVRDTA